MSSPNILRIVKQQGHFTLDIDKCYEDMKNGCWELLQQHHKDDTVPQPMFFCREDGKLQIWCGGCDYNETEESWGDETNIWGYAAEEFLEPLSKHLKGKGKVTFVCSPEGNPPEAFEVSPGKIKKLF